ncbi:MAG: hypothetical protein ACREJ9_00025 [Candidatus Rokuibacteriota bacterium]
MTRIRVASGRLDGFFTTKLYNRDMVVDGRPVRQPVREIDVHSVIVRPADGDGVAAGPQTIAGWAWSAREVARVEISVDDGRAWSPARLEPRSAPHAWQRFTIDWDARRGRYTLRCRATDAAGQTQPPTGRNRIFAISVIVS